MAFWQEMDFFVGRMSQIVQNRRDLERSEAALIFDFCMNWAVFQFQ